MSNFYQMPNGDLVDFTETIAKANPDGTLAVVSTQTGLQNYQTSFTNQAAAQAVVNDIASSVSAGGAALVSSILWSTDNSTWTALPISISAASGAGGFYLQVNGTGIPALAEADIINVPENISIITGPQSGATSSQVNFNQIGTGEAEADDTATLTLYINGPNENLVPVYTQVGAITFTS